VQEEYELPRFFLSCLFLLSPSFYGKEIGTSLPYCRENLPIPLLSFAFPFFEPLYSPFFFLFSPRYGRVRHPFFCCRRRCAPFFFVSRILPFSLPFPLRREHLFWGLCFPSLSYKRLLSSFLLLRTAQFFFSLPRYHLDGCFFLPISFSLLMLLSYHSSSLLLLMSGRIEGLFFSFLCGCRCDREERLPSPSRPSFPPSLENC